MSSSEMTETQGQLPDPASDPASETWSDPMSEVVPALGTESQAVALNPQQARPPANYEKAIELGHVLAASGYFPDARDPAKAAVRIMVGLDLGLSPTASLIGISHFEEKGKPVFLIEGKLLGALVQRHPEIEYKVLERDEQTVEIEFLRRGQSPGPNIVWDIDRAKRAGLTGKDNWKKYPREMLTWRALAEGVRLYFPDVLAGQPLYVDEEFEFDRKGSYQEALEGPKPQPLTDEKAEELRREAREFYDKLKDVNPDRLVPGRFLQALVGAEHSHAALEAKVEWLEDLLNTEIVVQGLVRRAEEQLGAEGGIASLLDRVERCKSNRDRIETLEVALEIDGETVAS